MLCGREGAGVSGTGRCDTVVGRSGGALGGVQVVGKELIGYARIGGWRFQALV